MEVSYTLKWEDYRPELGVGGGGPTASYTKGKVAVYYPKGVDIWT